MGTTQECYMLWTNPGSSTLQNSDYMDTYLPSHKPSNENKLDSEYCWWSKSQLISNILLWTPTHGHTSTDWPADNYILRLCVGTGCRLEDLPRVIEDRDGLWEKVKGIHAVLLLWWWSLLEKQNWYYRDHLRKNLIMYWQEWWTSEDFKIIIW